VKGRATATRSEGLRINPRDQVARWLLGRALKGAGAIPEALRQFEIAVAIAPESREGRQASDEFRALSAQCPDARGDPR